MNTIRIDIDYLLDIGAVQLVRASAYRIGSDRRLIATVYVICCRAHDTALVLASAQVGGVEVIDGIDSVIGDYGSMDDRAWADAAARIAARRYLRLELPTAAETPDQLGRFLDAL